LACSIVRRENGVNLSPCHRRPRTGFFRHDCRTQTFTVIDLLFRGAEIGTGSIQVGGKDEWTDRA
jgi:hypothetical protein